MQKIGIGLIGYGGIGRLHAYCYKSLPFLYDMPTDIDLVGIATSSPQSAQRAASQTNAIFTTTDYKELISRDDIHLIDICTPNNLHADIICAADKAGKHIYCEKPLTVNFDEANRIRRELMFSDRIFQMAFQYRFAPAILRARQLVEEGFLGEVLSFQAGYYHSGYLGTERLMSWRLRKSEGGGGALFDLGSHAVDLLYYITNQPAKRLLAKSRVLTPNRQEKDGRWTKVDVDDDISIMIELESGALGTLEASRIATGSFDDLNILVRGSKGAIAWHLMDPNWLEVYDANKPGKPLGGMRGWQKIEAIQNYPSPAAIPPGRATLGWSRLHAASQFNVIENILNGTSTGPGWEDAFYNQRFLEAAIQSSEQERWVEVFD